MGPEAEFDFLKTRRGFLKAVGLGAGTAIAWPDLQARPADPNAYPDLPQLQAAHEKLGMIPPNETYRTMEWALHFPP